MASQSLRRPLPKVQIGIGTNEPSEQKKKRKHIPLACARCRSHKIKCNGHRPSCSPCQARNVDCKYDDNSNLRRQYHHLDEQYQSLHKLLEILRSRPKDEALVILQHFRASGNVPSTLRHVEAGLPTRAWAAPKPTTISSSRPAPREPPVGHSRCRPLQRRPVPTAPRGNPI
ncbi:hypothetical protein PG995_009153 [Apiospora arundinis]